MSDNSWYENGELPPVGAKCKVDSKQCESRFVKQFHGKTVDILMHMTDHVGDNIAIFSMPDPSDKACLRFHGMVAGCFIPIKTERELAIEEMAIDLNIKFNLHDQRVNCEMEVTLDLEKDILGKLYDAGYRKNES